MSQFLTHTAVLPQGEFRWQAEVHRGWRIGSVANGGYVLALVGRTLAEALNQPDPLSINAFYLAPVALGEVEVAVESLRRPAAPTLPVRIFARRASSSCAPPRPTPTSTS